MESPAQYWKPVWRQGEPWFKLPLAQAPSNRAPRGRESDFRDAERLVRRQIAGQLILSCVPEPEQRLGRTLTRTRYPLTKDRVRLYGQWESPREEARLKLSSGLSDWLGVSGQRMLQAWAKGETDPAKLAAMADKAVRVVLIDQQIAKLDHSLAAALKQHNGAVVRLAEVPGYGAEAAPQVIAEVGPEAAALPSAGHLASGVGACPGREESAEVARHHKSPKGNRPMRRTRTEVAHAAVKTKGSIFQVRFHRLVPKIGFKRAIWAIVHQLCRVTWKVLHDGVQYEERGGIRDPKLAADRKRKLARQLRALGYDVQLTPLAPARA